MAKLQLVWVANPKVRVPAGHAPKRPRTGTYGARLLAIFPAIALFMLVSSPSAYLFPGRLVAALVVATPTVVILGVVRYLWPERARESIVYLASKDEFVFVTRARNWVYFTIAGCLMVAAAGVAVTSMYLDTVYPVFGTDVDAFRLPALFAVIGFAFILLQLLLTRTAPRLELTPDAVLYRRGWNTATIPWASVGTLTLEPRRRKLHLILTEQNGRSHDVTAALPTSDPVSVAEIICYFADEPGERMLLGDPESAIQAVGGLL
ncbi:hypothetical protein [Mycetocola saprophilus]|uniref:hypothetical protein n=1 Tax=Mycetocola saprophilus TaxID=76636 RepID=UPI0012DBCC80|nr:hypothetical protein [Mycetocola saprophilus]